MNRYRSNEWKQLHERRLARKAQSELCGDHPLAHIDRLQCHQWMREDCVQYDSAREAREDNLIGVVIQITSAALLAIPGLIFGVSQKFPKFSDAPFVHIGLLGLFLSLVLAMGEQLLSAHAYKRRRDIAINYYQKKSSVTSDRKFSNCTNAFRYLAYLLFVISLVISALAISYYEEPNDVERQYNTSPTSPTSPTPTNR